MSLFDLLTLLALLPALATGLWMIYSARDAGAGPPPPSPRPRLLRPPTPTSSPGPALLGAALPSARPGR